MAQDWSELVVPRAPWPSRKEGKLKPGEKPQDPPWPPHDPHNPNGFYS